MGFLSTQATTTNIQTVSPGILVPSGVVFPFAGTVAPSGYLLCDGSAISRSTYSALFTAISTSYGNGDGTTTFNLPDLRFTFIRGAGANISVTGSGTASSNNATFTNHNVNRTGMKVRLSSGTLSGLATSTDYYAIVIGTNNDTLAFASSYANAISGSKIAISGTNSAVIIQYEDPDITTRLQAGVGGATSGSGTRQIDQNQAHSHSVSASWYAAGGGLNASTGSGAFPSGIGLASITSNMANSGGGEGRPQNVYMNHIIKI